MASTTQIKGIHLDTIEGLVIELNREIADLETEWRELEATGSACMYQHYDWVRMALQTIDGKNEPCLVTGRNDDGLQFILPLVIARGSFFSTLRWAGGTHANLCSGLYSIPFLKRSDTAIIRKVFAAIGKHLPGPVIARLGNQRFELNGYRNPLLAYPHQISVNRMYDMDLSSGFEAVLQIGNAKRKRKIFRRQGRLAEENGGYEFTIPETPEEIDAALEIFFIEKTKRLKELGAPEVFDTPEAREFIRMLAHSPEKNGIQPFRIFELKVGGKSRAMYGCGIYGDYCQASVNCVTYDDLAHMSPGEMVLYLMVEHLCEEGFNKLDLGLGDERYKRSWCKSGHNLFDTVIPVTGSAVPFVMATRTKIGIKRFVRRNEMLWQSARKLRQKLSSLKKPG